MAITFSEAKIATVNAKLAAQNSAIPLAPPPVVHQPPPAPVLFNKKTVSDPKTAEVNAPKINTATGPFGFKYTAQTPVKSLGELTSSKGTQETPAPVLYTPQQAAALLGINTKTLAKHVNDGNIRYIDIGHGTVRKAKRFTQSNIETFLKNQKVKGAPECPSIKTPKAHTTPTISSSTVVAFSALQKPRTKKTLKP